MFKGSPYRMEGLCHLSTKEPTSVDKTIKLMWFSIKKDVLVEKLHQAHTNMRMVNILI